MSDDKFTHRIRQIHGLAGVTKGAMLDDTTSGQDIRVQDDGDYIWLSLSTSSFPAKLTAEQARYIAARLNEAADRANPDWHRMVPFLFEQNAPAAPAKPKGGHPLDKWDGAAVIRLTKLRSEGKGFAKITKTLNEEFPGRNYTQQACIGKAARLKLPKLPAVSSIGAALGRTFPTVDAFIAAVPGMVPGGIGQLYDDSESSEQQEMAANIAQSVINEALDWYRQQGLGVFKVDGKFDLVDGVKGLLPEEFLRNHVNPLRRSMGLQEF